MLARKFEVVLNEKVMKSLLFICSLLVALTSFGQSPKLEREQKKIVDAKYIIEGRFLKDSYHAYFGPDSSATYGSSLFEITKVFRGDIKLGTVKGIFQNVPISASNGILVLFS